MLEADVSTNIKLANHGADHIIQNCAEKPVKILTHCNTGSLATGGYGTALGKPAQIINCHIFCACI